MLTLFKAIESVKMGLKRVKKKIGGGEKLDPGWGKKSTDLKYIHPRKEWRNNHGGYCEGRYI